MSDFDIEQQKLFLKTVGRYVEDRIKLATAPLLKRIEELEASGIKYVGTYQRAAEYRRGDVTNHEGGMWVALSAVPPQEVPGKSVCWQLSVKSSNGRDHTPRQPTLGGARPQSIVERRP